MSNIIRTSAEIAAGAAAAGVLIFAWWRIRRRSWTERVAEWAANQITRLL